MPPSLLCGLTYLPVRFPAEALGATVHWDQSRCLVSITLPAPRVAGFVKPAANPPAPCSTCVQSIPMATRGGELIGVVVGLSMNQMAVQVGQCIETFAVTPGTCFTLMGYPISFSQLQRGRSGVDGSGCASFRAASPGRAHLPHLPTPLPERVGSNRRSCSCAAAGHAAARTQPMSVPPCVSFSRKGNPARGCPSGQGRVSRLDRNVLY